MELRDYARILRSHWLGVLLLTVLGVVVALGWSLLQPRVYTATATGYVAAVQQAGDSSSTGTSTVGDQLAKSKVKSFVQIGEWRAVAEHAIDELGLATTPEALVSHVTLSNPLDTVVIQVSARASTPEGARDLAEAWVRGLAAEIDNIEGDGTPGSAPVSLTPGDSAALPSAPSSPNTRLNVALGGLIGLALGIGYAVLRHMLDRRLRNPEEIERETGVAVVGTLPLEKSLTGNRTPLTFDARLKKESALLAESIRELRSNLRFMDVDHPPRIIVVTSPLPGDGKSTVSANLALSLAEAGQNVTLIDGDLRRPVVGEVFGLPGDAGVTDVLAGAASVDDVAYYPHRSGKLRVLTAGRIPPNPSEILGSQRMRDLLAQLAEDGMVVVDAPPVIPVTDASVLSHSGDGALLVVSAGRTTYDMLHKALGNMTKANARVLGVVLNRVPRRGADAGYYGYQYQGDYASATQTVKVDPEVPPSRAAQRSARRHKSSGTPGVRRSGSPTR